MQTKSQIWKKIEFLKTLAKNFLYTLYTFEFKSTNFFIQIFQKVF